MENFFIEDNFYHDIGDLLDYFDIENVEELEDDWALEAYEAVLEPIVIFTPENIRERVIYEDRYIEETYDVKESQEFKIEKILRENIDFDKINALMPKNYYGGKRFIITKQDLIEYVK